MTNLYYNPKLNKLGVGVWYTFSDPTRFYLIVDTIDEKTKTFEVLEITKKWLEGWEFIDSIEGDIL